MHHRIRKISDRAKAVPIHHWALMGILLVGIFLRTYEFREWMTFNPDQARDAILVGEMLDGNVWPLLGPQAGSTTFSLGPLFYYFEYAAAMIFGPTADKMAYVDLAFSIGAIVLLYLFLKKFFRERLSLALTFLFSISFFVVTYSRFAFNPNSIPFFVLLFLLSLLAILDHAPREKLWWAALLGLSMGAGFQLHTMLFLALPFLALLVFGYLLVKRHFLWRSFLLTLAVFTFVNAPQAVSEYRTGGMNMKSFFLEAEETGSGGFWKNIGGDIRDTALCHAEGYAYMVSSIGDGDKCDLTKLAGRIESKGLSPWWQKLVVAMFDVVFVLGGALLFCLAWKREEDRKRRQAFALVAAYALIIFGLLLSVSANMSIRYFIVVEFIPFLFLGFWIQFLHRHMPRISLSRWILIVLVFFGGLNFLTMKRSVTAYLDGTAGNDSVAIYGEVEAMSRYILSRSDGSDRIFFSGRKRYLSRYWKPIEYFVRQEGKTLPKVVKRSEVGVSDPFFYVTKRVSMKNGMPVVFKEFETVDVAHFGNMSILQLVRKSE